MAGIWIPSRPEDIGALAVGQGGINRGTEFPDTPKVGEYFYHETVSIMFQRVFLNGLELWDAIECYSSDTLDVYLDASAPDGGFGYTAESPVNSNAVASLLVPRVSRGPINIHYKGDLSQTGALQLNVNFIGYPWHGIRISGSSDLVHEVRHVNALEGTRSVVLEPNFEPPLPAPVWGFVSSEENGSPTAAFRGFDNYTDNGYVAYLILPFNNDRFAPGDPIYLSYPQDHCGTINVKTNQRVAINRVVGSLVVTGADMIDVDSCLFGTFSLINVAEQWVERSCTNYVEYIDTIVWSGFDQSVIRSIEARNTDFTLEYGSITIASDYPLAQSTRAVTLNRSHMRVTPDVHFTGWETGIKINRWSVVEYIGGNPTMHNCSALYAADGTTSNGLYIEG